MRTENQKVKNISPAERRRRMQWTGFILFNSAILLGAAALMPYRALADGALKNFIFCFWNRYLHIYCPTCGVTRMLDSLLHLRFADAAPPAAPTQTPQPTAAGSPPGGTCRPVTA